MWPIRAESFCELWRLTGLGRYEDASGELRQLLREQPRFGEANFQLGLVLIAQKQFDKAEDLLKRVRVANPSDSRPTIALAELYGSEGQFEKAVVLLRKALDTTATDQTKLRASLASILVRSQKLDAAAEEYQRLAAAEPAVVEWHLRLGDVMQQKGNLTAAVSVFQTATQNGPSLVVPALMLAGSLERTGRTQEACIGVSQGPRIKAGAPGRNE